MDGEEEKVRDFYDHYGWVVRGGVSGEHALFREFSQPYYSYHDGVAARTMDSFADLDGQLLLAGGGDLPEIHLTVARKFSHTTCLDISKVAIDIARNKLENKGEFIVGSILEIPKPDASFDAVYCAHVIYHIDKDQQEKAVRELIRHKAGRKNCRDLLQSGFSAETHRRNQRQASLTLEVAEKKARQTIRCRNPAAAVFLCASPELVGSVR